MAGERVDLAQDLIDSDHAFRETFDRSSGAFHGGVTTAVPLGGSRVPESMKEAETAAPVASSAGGESLQRSLSTFRTLLTRMKRSIVDITKTLEGIDRIASRGLPETSRPALLKYLASATTWVPAFRALADETTSTASTCGIELDIGRASALADAIDALGASVDTDAAAAVAAVHAASSAVSAALSLLHDSEAAHTRRRAELKSKVEEGSGAGIGLE